MLSTLPRPAWNRPLHTFDGTIDQLVPDDALAKKRFGWTKNRWLNDPRVPGSPLDPSHPGTDNPDHPGIGHIMQPYITRDGKGEMLGFQGGLYKDDPRAQNYIQRLEAGDPTLAFSIQYSTELDLHTGDIADVGLLRCAFVDNPHNTRCRVRVEQSADGKSVATFNIPIKITKTPSASIPFAFPLRDPTKMSTPAPPPASAAAPPAQPPAGGAAAQPPAQPPAAQQPPPASENMDTSDIAAAEKLAKEVAGMSAEQLRAKYIESMSNNSELQQLKAERAQRAQIDAERQKVEIERQQKEAEQRFKDGAIKYQPVLKASGLLKEDGNVADDVADVHKFVLSDPNAEKSGANKLYTTVMDTNIKLSAELEKERAQNVQLQSFVDVLKRQRGVAPPQFSANKQDATLAQHSPAIANALAQQGAADKAASAMPTAPGQLHPLTRTNLAFPIRTGPNSYLMPGGTGAAAMNPQTMSGAPGMARLLTVQDAATGGPKTGDATATYVDAPRHPVIETMESHLVHGSSSSLRTADGYQLKLGSLFPGAERPGMGGFHSDDLNAMKNIALNQNLALQLSTSNANQRDGRWVADAKRGRGDDE
jgi:hypothetical protein